MVKKQRTVNTPQLTKIKSSKSNKTKNKQMFTELKTHQENKISKFNGLKSSHMNHHQQMIDQADQNSFQGNIQQLSLRKNQDIQQTCAIVHQLLSKNKISAKNAFDVPMILQTVQDFDKISSSENGWSKMSSTLQADSKIYSYRVDAIHSIAFKIVNTMARNRDDALQKQGQQGKKQNQQQIQGQKRIVPISDDMDVTAAQLQKNIQNINLQSLDKFVSQFNPTFQRTRRRFDQNGLRGMLLNNIQLDSNLQLSLNLTRKIRPTGFYQQAMPVKVDQLKQPLQICKSIQNIKKTIFSITKQQFIPSTGYQISWRRVRQAQLSFQRIGAQINNQNAMDIQGQQQRNQNMVYKKVQDAIKLKNKKKVSLKSSSDIVQDGIGWLSQTDKKMLGISTKNQNITQNTLIKKSSSIKVQRQRQRQRNEDDIDFQMSKLLQKKQVFTEQTTQKHKQQFNQQIQQKHLLPLRLFYKFKVQQIMTLRQQPPQILHQPDPQNYQQEIYQHLRQRQQIDIKRQQISIRQSKQQLKNILKKQMKFSTLCNKFEIIQRNVTPKLCFLTILHLANQNNLRLEQSTDFDFIIKS